MQARSGFPESREKVPARGPGDRASAVSAPSATSRLLRREDRIRQRALREEAPLTDSGEAVVQPAAGENPERTTEPADHHADVRQDPDVHRRPQDGVELDV